MLHTFCMGQKVERMRESLANVRTKWEAVEQRAQQFFEDHYDWRESTTPILALLSDLQDVSPGICLCWTKSKESC